MRNPVLARAIITGGIALLAAVQVVRTAATSAYLESEPAIAARIWSNHPEVNFAVAMAEIGQTAAGGNTGVPAPTLRRVVRASNSAPLAVEPFLIKGALAKAQGRENLAERLFVEARARDPRSAAARYFLAERYLSSGRASEGLGDVAVLARLVPGGSQLLVPGLAQYARTPGAVPRLRRMFAGSPEIGEAVLAQLASDAANADLILRIAGPAVNGAGKNVPAPAWQARLLNALVVKGEFDRARDLWSGMSGIRPASSTAVVNKGFEEINGPPPFNWAFGSGSFGVAEPAAGGQLKVIFYGRDTAELASQLLLLPQGTYRIQMIVSGDAGGASGLEWSVSCLPGKATLASIPLSGATLAGKRLGGTFAVPGEACAAQWLKLTGTGQEFPKSEQVTIGNFDLSPVGRE